VHTDVAAIGGRVARLVLLACTLFGLAAMHTLGHGATHHGEPAAAVTLFSVATPAAPHDCGADGCDRAAAARMPGHGMNGWDLCVAVLSAFAIAALVAALLLTAAASRSARRPPGDPGRRSPRAPPTLSFGLTLATVSVLRT